MGGIWCLKSSLKEKKICIYTHTYIITLKGKSALYLIAIYFLKTSCKKFHSVPIAIYSKEYNNIVHFLKVCLGPRYVGKLYFSDFFFFNPPTNIGPNFAYIPYVIQISLPVFCMLSLASVLLERQQKNNVFCLFIITYSYRRRTATIDSFISSSIWGMTKSLSGLLPTSHSSIKLEICSCFNTY